MKNISRLSIVPAMLLAMTTVTGCGKQRSIAYEVDLGVDVRGTTIQFWTPFGSGPQEPVSDLVEEFEKLTGVEVELESKGGYNDLRKAVTMASTKGGYPHLVLGYPDHFASYVKSDIIVRLDYYFENDVHNDTFEPAGESFKMSDFYADYMVENQTIEFDKEGKGYTLGVPFNKSTEVLIYNKTFFDWCIAQNITGIKVPETYAEVESVGKAILKLLKDKSAYGKILASNGNVYDDIAAVSAASASVVLNLTGIHEATGGPTVDKTAFKPFSYDSQANLFITTVRQNGGTYTEIDKNTGKGYLAFDSQETLNGLNTIKGLYDDKVFGIPADWAEASYGSNPFKASKSVMTLGSSAGVANDAPAGTDAFKIAAAPVPYHSADKKYVISQGTNLALLDKGSEQQRVAAWQLLKFLSKYANGYFCSKTGYYPSCPYAEIAGADGTSGMWANMSEAFEDTDYATWLSEAKVSLNQTDKIRAQTAEVNLNNYIADGSTWVKFTDPPFSGSDVVREAVASITPWVFYNEKTAKGAIEAMYAELSDYVRK